MMRYLAPMLALAAACSAPQAPEKTAADSMDPAATAWELDYRTFWGIPTATAGEQTLYLDVFVPVGVKKPVPVVLYFHGGGWRKSPRPKGPGIGKTVLREGYAYAKAQYTTSDLGAWPKQLHDVQSALDSLFAYADAFGIDTSRVGLWGDSAGGHIALALGFSESDRIAAIANWYGPTTFLSDYAEFAGVAIPLLGCHPDSCREQAVSASPLFLAHAAAPPVLTEHGALDPIVSVRQAELLHQRLDSLGVSNHLIVRPEGKHGEWWSMETRPDAVIDFFDSTLKAE